MSASPPLTEEELREIRERQATLLVASHNSARGFLCRADAIGHAYTDIDRLLDTIKADRAEIGRLRGCLAESERQYQQKVSEIGDLLGQLSTATRTERDRCAKIARDYPNHFDGDRIAQAIEGSDDPNPRGENV